MLIQYYFTILTEKNQKYGKFDFLDKKKSSNNLSSQQGNPQVFSAHLGLTSVFGMGTGITLNVIVTRKLSYAII